MDILRKSLAPITADAWSEINEEADRTLRGNLSARSLVDFDGPHGLELGAINLGRVALKESEPVSGVKWGLRQVRPLVEVRVPFQLSLSDLDDVSRGAKAPELDPVAAAARKTAILEENTLYNGFGEGDIKGILESTSHKAIQLGPEVGDYAENFQQATGALQGAGIGGPYALVLGSEPYKKLMAGDKSGYPIRRRAESMFEGGIKWSPALEGGAVVSTRGGDYEMTVGLDLSIGYKFLEGDTLELYFTESFTFQVLEPAAAVGLKPVG